MKVRYLSLLFAAATLYGEQPSDVLKTWFPDGTGLELYTTSSGRSTPLSSSGGVLVGHGKAIQRAVVGQNGGVMFAYEIEATKLGDGKVSLRMLPLDERKLRELKWRPTGRPIGAVPTLTGPRDFPSLQAGDAIELDILYNPTTNEKIWDVVRVSAEPAPKPEPAPNPKPRGNQFSFQEVRVTINGKVVQEPRNTWIIGQAAAIRLPERGKFYLTLNPTPNYPFKASGWVDHNILRMAVGSDLVEITGKSNILQKSDYGTVWIYQETADAQHLASELSRLSRTHAPNHPSIRALQRQLEDLPRGFSIDTADEVEMLIPKSVNQREE